MSCFDCVIVVVVVAVVVVVVLAGGIKLEMYFSVLSASYFMNCF